MIVPRTIRPSELGELKGVDQRFTVNWEPLKLSL